jgi:hypothetical protein
MYFRKSLLSLDKKSINISLGVSICLDVVSIETLDLDVVKELVSTVEKISTASKS